MRWALIVIGSTRQFSPERMGWAQLKPNTKITLSDGRGSRAKL